MNCPSTQTQLFSPWICNNLRSHQLVSKFRNYGKFSCLNFQDHHALLIASTNIFSESAHIITPRSMQCHLVVSSPCWKRSSAATSLEHAYNWSFHVSVHNNMLAMACTHPSTMQCAVAIHFEMSCTTLTDILKNWMLAQFRQADGFYEESTFCDSCRHRWSSNPLVSTKVCLIRHPVGPFHICFWFKPTNFVYILIWLIRLRYTIVLVL